MRTKDKMIKSKTPGDFVWLPISEVTKFKAEDFAQSYAGRIGCACGCRGKYSENRATITRAYNKMVRLGTEFNKQVGTSDYLESKGPQYFYLETGNGRCMTIYRNK